MSKIPFPNCQNFPFQTVKISLFKLSKFPFPNCQNFPFQTVKISLFKTVQKSQRNPETNPTKNPLKNSSIHSHSNQTPSKSNKHFIETIFRTTLETDIANFQRTIPRKKKLCWCYLIIHNNTNIF